MTVVVFLVGQDESFKGLDATRVAKNKLLTRQHCGLAERKKYSQGLFEHYLALVFHDIRHS